MINQKIKDLGGGVIEITLEYNKRGGARNNNFSLPWSAYRTDILPEILQSKPDGSYSWANQKLFKKQRWPSLRAGAIRSRLKDGSMGGCVALASSKSPDARGIGIVFGQVVKGLDKRSVVTMGNYGPVRKPKIGGTIVAVYRDVSLGIGESLYYRYYLVLGKLADIQAKANMLESQVKLKKITRSQGDAEELKICLKKDGVLTRSCSADDRLLFQALKDFVPDSKPLFLLQNMSTGKYLITDDPYEISFDPTDGRSKYVDFLGWAVKKLLAENACRYLSLNEVVRQNNPHPETGINTSSLYVMGPSDVACISSVVR